MESWREKVRSGESVAAISRESGKSATVIANAIADTLFDLKVERQGDLRRRVRKMVESPEY